MSMPTFLKRSVDGGAVDRLAPSACTVNGSFNVSFFSHSTSSYFVYKLYPHHYASHKRRWTQNSAHIPRLFSVWENSDFPSHYSTIPAGDEPLGIFYKFIVVTPFHRVPRTKYPRIMSSPADLQSNNRTRCRVSDFPHVQVVRWISLPDEWPGEK